MSDLVERLRRQAPNYGVNSSTYIIRLEAATEIERLQDKNTKLRAWAEDEQQKREKVEEDRLTERQENERLTAALHQISEWSRAYPLKVFPEPDFAKAAELLKASGMTLDAISASNMRHVIEGVGRIAQAALDAGHQQLTRPVGTPCRNTPCKYPSCDCAR